MWDFETNAELDEEVATTGPGAIPEQFRPFYEQDAESKKFKLKASDPIVKGALEAILGLNKALGAERKAKGNKVDMSILKDFGATPEEIKAAFDAKVAELTSADKKIDLPAIKAQIAEQFKTQITATETTNTALRSQLDSMMMDQAATVALSGLTDQPELVLPFIRQQLRAVEEDGVRSVIVVAEDGKTPRVSPVTAGYMTVAELVKEMTQNKGYARLFNSQAPPGLPRPGDKPGKPTPGKVGDNNVERSGTEKIAAGLDALMKGVAPFGR